MIWLYLWLPLSTGLLASFVAFAFGWAIQFGLKKKWPQMVKQISHTFETQLISRPSLDSVFEKLDVEKAVVPLVRKRLDLLAIDLKEKNPMIALFVSESLEKSLKKQAMDQLLLLLPELQDTAIERLQSPDIKHYIKKRLLALDLHPMHSKIKQLMPLPVLLAFLVGLVIGVLQTLVLHLLYSLN